MYGLISVSSFCDMTSACGSVWCPIHSKEQNLPRKWGSGEISLVTMAVGFCNASEQTMSASWTCSTIPPCPYPGRLGTSDRATAAVNEGCRRTAGETGTFPQGRTSFLSASLTMRAPVGSSRHSNIGPHAPGSASHAAYRILAEGNSLPQRLCLILPLTGSTVGATTTQNHRWSFTMSLNSQ